MSVLDIMPEVIVVFATIKSILEALPPVVWYCGKIAFASVVYIAVLRAIRR